MPTKQPLVSICMPCYNHEHFIAQAIESCLAQTYKDIEIIVGDDRSTDGTWAIVERYRDAHPDIVKPFRNECNRGVTPNCNAILRRCTGKYIAFHSGDDLYLPEKLQRQVAAMESASAVLSYHDVEVFDSDSGATLRHWNSGPDSFAPVVGNSHEVARRLVEDGTVFMAALSVMVLRTAMSVGFDERVRVASDWLAWIEVCAGAEGAVVHVDDVLARYRRHNTNVSSDFRNYFDDELISLAIVEHRYPEFVEAGAINKRRRGLSYREAVHYIGRGHEKIGRNYLLASLGHPAYTGKALVRWLFSFAGMSSILKRSDRWPCS